MLGNQQLLGNPEFFQRQMMTIVIKQFRAAQPPGPDANTCRLINQLLVSEYLNESQGRLAL